MKNYGGLGSDTQPQSLTVNYTRYPPSLHALLDLWDKNYVTWYFRGQTGDKICQYELSQSSLFIHPLIHSKQDDDFIVMQNGHIEFWKDLYYYCLA